MNSRLLIFAFVVACKPPDPGPPPPRPEESARAWASSLGLKAEGVVCAGTDSDHDGYVSCDLNVGNGRIESIQCAARQQNEFYVNSQGDIRWSPTTFGCKGSAGKATATLPR